MSGGGIEIVAAQPTAGIFEILVDAAHHQVDGAAVIVADDALVGVLPRVERKFGEVVVVKGAEGIDKSGELALAGTTFCHYVGHLVAVLLLSEDVALKYRNADLCANYGKKHRNAWLVYIF